MEDFARITGRPVRSVTRLDPGYSGSGSDVWRVDGDGGAVVVRRSRQAPPGRGPFFAGVRRLFGTRPWEPASVAAAHGAMARLAPVPRVLAVAPPYLVVEHLPGQAPATFAGLGAALGDVLGAVHARAYPWWGHPSGSPAHPLRAFHPRLAATMAELAGTPGSPALRRHLPQVPAAVRDLPDPEAGVLHMADLDPTQVLVADGRISGLVDLEALVVAPPALEFAALEYLLSRCDASAFVRAYRRHRQPPDITAVRPLYRTWLYLIRFQGQPDFGAWQAQPALFGPAGPA